MALLYSKKKNDDHYEVRSHGNTVRLYKNGVCHSDYNPVKLFNGAVWDLMFVSLFSSRKLNKKLSKGRKMKILVLGVGGGNIIHTINRFVKNAEITAIDLDSLNLFVAKKYFGLNYINCELITGDAFNFLLKTTKKFDFIIDDIFTENKSEPCRALPFDKRWFNLIWKCLNKSGTHIINMADYSEFKASEIYTQKEWLKNRLHLSYLKSPKCENAVFVFSRDIISRQEIASNLRSLNIWPLKKSRAYPQFRIRSIN